MFASILCLGIIAFIIFLIIKSSSKNNNTGQNKSNSGSSYSASKRFTIPSFISYLEALKEEGSSTIDDVIKDLSLKIGKSYTVTAKEKIKVEKADKEIVEAIKSKVAQVETSKIEKESKKESLDTANLLLYLGAFVFLFAMFIFAAFTWTMYSATFKVILILLVPVLFFVASLYLKPNKKFETAASLFQTISAVTIAFAGLGIWNFVTFPATIIFWEYWLGYSLFALSFYSIFLFFLKEKKYQYYMLGAAVSLIISFAYAFADMALLRLITIAILNIVLYIVVYTFNLHKDKVFSSVIMSIQRIVDISIAFAVLLHNPSSYGNFEITVAILGLIIPWGFELYKAYVEKDEYAKYISLLSVVPKVFLATLAFDVPGVTKLYVVAASTVSMQFVAEFLIDAKEDSIKGASRLFNSIILGFLTFLVLPWYRFMGISSKGYSILTSVSDLEVILVTMLSSVGLILPLWKVKESPYYGLAILPLILGLYSVFNPISLGYIWIIVVIGLLLMLLYVPGLSKHETFGLVNVIDTLCVVGIWQLLVNDIPDSSLHIGVVALIVSIVMTFVRRYRGSKNYSLYAAPFLFISAVGFNGYLGDVMDSRSFFLRENFELLTFFIPVLYYTLIAFLEKNKEHVQNALLPYLLFGLMVIAMSMINIKFFALLALPLMIVSLLVYVYKGNQNWLSFPAGVLILFFVSALSENYDLSSLFTYAIAGTVVFVVVVSADLLDIKNKLLNGISTVFSFYAFFHIFLGFVWSSSNSGLPFDIPSWLSKPQSLIISIIGILLSVMSLLIKNSNKWIPRFASVGFVVMTWMVSSYYDLDTQFFIVPLTIYLGTLALVTDNERERETSKAFEALAVLIQGGSLLMQSLIGTEAEQLSYGIALIALSLIFTLIGNQTKRKSMYYLGIMFLALELLIRLWFVIVLIPWWVYLAIIGVALMGAGLYSVSKHK